MLKLRAGRGVPYGVPPFACSMSLGAVVVLALMSILSVPPSDANPAGQRCVVSGSNVTLPPVTVHTGTQSFDVRVTGVPAVAVTTGDGVEVAISGAIAFKGTIADKIWYAARTEIVSELVTISTAGKFIGDRADGDEMIGRAVIHANDVLHGEAKEPDVATSPIRVPCARLSLDWPALEPRDDDEGIATTAQWVTRSGNAIVLHREPRDRARGMTIAMPSCEGEGCIVFSGVARRGAWLKVAVRNEGVTAAGWVRAGRVKQLPASEGAGYAYSCTGDHGGSMFMQLIGPTSRARIAAGTPIFTEPAKEVWATVQHEEGYEVVYTDGEPWVRVVSIPGVELGIGAAFVPAAAVRLER